MLMPWVIPIKEKSDATDERLRTIDLIPIVGPLRGTFGIQIVRQSEHGGEFINERSFTGCQPRG
eukprot:6445343-Prorocentrum_lima.AAC.1